MLVLSPQLLKKIVNRIGVGHVFNEGYVWGKEPAQKNRCHVPKKKSVTEMRFEPRTAILGCICAKRLKEMYYFSKILYFSVKILSE